MIDLETAFQLIQVIDCSGVIPLVRLNENDESTIRRVMDAGAAGIIAPMVNTVEDARKAVNAVKYPPIGKRSFGLGRAHDFGLGFDEYVGTINDHSIVVVQIEHIVALKNLDKILQVPGIDAIIIGPYDLSGSLGYRASSITPCSGMHSIPSSNESGNHRWLWVCISSIPRKPNSASGSPPGSPSSGLAWILSFSRKDHAT